MGNLINKVLYKNLTYKITITDIGGESKLPPEFEEDFFSWLKSLAAELGVGEHREWYSNHIDDPNDSTYIDVHFKVDIEYGKL